MGDAFDEEDDRLMIDDANGNTTAYNSNNLTATSIGTDTSTSSISSVNTMLDSTATVGTHPVSASTTTSSSYHATNLPHKLNFNASNDVVEKHPVDPEQKKNFFNDGTTSKMASATLRDDPLKVTIRTTHNPMAATTFASEKLSDDDEELCKEEGEIDDEDESVSGTHSHSASSSALQQNLLNWPSVDENASLDGIINGTTKFAHSKSQQQHEHNTALISSKNVNSSTGIDENNVTTTTTPAYHRSNHQAVNANNSSNRSCSAAISQIKKIKDESEGSSKVASTAASSVVDNVGTSAVNSSASPSYSKTKNRKKRRISGDDSDGTQLQAANNPTTSTSSSVVPTISNISTEAAVKRKKQNTRDKSSNVSTKSVQTNEDDVEVTVGSTHCLDFTVLAKVPGQTSDSLYFVTNWNGRELYGILGDGLPSLHQSFQNKRPIVNANVNGDTAFETSTTNVSSHDRSNGTTPSKQRIKSQRNNRTLSVGTPNGSADAKTRKIASCSLITNELSNHGMELQNDEEMSQSQSPVSWLCGAGGSDPLYGIGNTAIGTTSGLAQLRELNQTQMICCPVAGCGYYFDTSAQLSMHYPHHFNQFRRAIYTETMGSQTDAIRTQLCRDAYTEPMSGVEQASSMFQSTSCNASTQTTPSPSKDALRPQLSNSEERSIHELFQVARRTNPEESKRDFLDGHRSGGLTTSKGFESRAASVCEVGKASSIPTALDAMEKMVSEGSLSSGEGVIGSSFSSISSQQHNTNTTSSAHPSTSLAGNSHTSAGSPVFSDISDDAPTLEKEVVDKTEDRCSERMKLVASTRSPVVSLSLPINSDKVRSDASAVSTTASNTVDLQSVPSSSLSANLLPSSKSASTNQSSIRPINDSITSTNHIPTLSTDSRREMKPICVSSSSATTTPLISFSPAIPPFVGIDPATFTNAVRPAVGGVGVAGGSGGVSMMYNYNPNYMMQPFGISNPTSAVVSAALQSSSSGITTSSSVSTKHKIHDLKTVGAFTNAQGIGTELSKDSTKLSPSLLTSSDTRSPSTNTTNVAVASGLSNTSGNGLNLKNLSSASSSSQQQQQVNVATSSHAQTQTPPSRPVTFLLGQQQSSSVSLQSTPERTPNPTAALLQQQQQHQQQAHYLAQMQQQQQMQQYMSQMRFAGGFPMIPPTNPGMAHQAYEQALVAMQAGIAPANFGLFTPQSFQPK